MHYRDQFKNRLNQLKSENRYRSFVELERRAGRHPYATWNSPTGPQDVVIWCSNDYLGMGQHPSVIDATHPIGEAFLMGFIPGESIPQKWLVDDTYEAARSRLAFQCGEALGRIHSIDCSELPPNIGPRMLPSS